MLQTWALIGLSAIVSVSYSLACGSEPVKQDTVAPSLGRVVVQSMSPTAGPLGTELIISGSGFTPTHNAVGFGNPNISDAGGRHAGYLNGLSSSDGRTLRLRLPDNASQLLEACPIWQLRTGEACPTIGLTLPLGESEIFVVNDDGESNHVTFTVRGAGTPEADPPEG